MGKGQIESQQKDSKSHKSHKTLRQKLRKKRQSLKQHRKEKSEKKKQYNASEQKLSFFSQGNKEEGDKTVKLKKIIKYIEKFINIYEDDLNQFYDMFKTFDQGGGIDISGLQNKALCKCLKKLFKYLPLKKQQGEFKKIQNSTVNLEAFIKGKVTQAIEYYLENGSQQCSSDEQESSGEQRVNKKQKKGKHKKVQKPQQDDNEPAQPIRLYKNVVQAVQEPGTCSMGPSIPAQYREKLAEMFDQQLKEMQVQKEAEPEKQEDEFDQIFSMYQTRQQMKNASKPVVNQGVPAHLMAAGSALIGQKAEIDEAEIQEYNKIYRPKRLVDIHKELKEGQQPVQPKKRQSFNRQRDILGQGRASIMSNSTFFDFRSKMTKPKSTNQFL